MYGLATLTLRSPLAVINRKIKKQGGEGLQADSSRNHPRTQPDPEKDGANGTSSDNGTVRTGNESGKRFLRSDIVGDGSCLFRAISLYLYGSQDQHQQIRMSTTNYIHDNWPALKIYVVTNDERSKDAQTYCQYMSQNSTYGTSLEIHAISENYYLNICVYLRQEKTHQKKIIIHDNPIRFEKSSNKTVHLLLTGNPENGHFELITPENPIKENPTNMVQKPDETRPAKSVSQIENATTKAGCIRQRMAWTDEMNKTVMRCYYLATKLERIKVGYRLELHKLFVEQYPHLNQHVTAQRLMDQKRVIINNKRLTTHELQNIKEEVGKIIKEEQVESHEHRGITVESPQQTEEPHDKENILLQTPSENNTKPTETLKNIQQNLEREMETNMTIWKHSDPTKRPPLPRLIFKRNSHILIKIMNEQILKNHIKPECCLEHLQTIVYSAASTILKCNDQKITKHVSHTKNKTPKKPKWQVRIEQRIQNLRQGIGRITQYLQGNRSRNIVKRIKEIIKNNQQPMPEILDTFKQKLMVYAGRLRRYKESNDRKADNLYFNTNQKLFYNKLTQKREIQITPPTVTDMSSFWKSIWSENIEHNSTAAWIKHEEDRQSNAQEQTNYEITKEEILAVIRKTHNWKSPGTDQIHNFWYKQLSAIHPSLTSEINKVIAHPDSLPAFLTEGNTYLIPKDNDTKNPANYRPITCLQTLYKIITSCICLKIEEHLMDQNLLTEEQKGCRKNSQGCKEQLIIDSVIMKQVEKQHRNLHTCYIDYKKAFDTVPHSWLRKVLQIYKIHPTLCNFLSLSMTKWKTKIHLSTDKEHLQTDHIPINRGIFQGDSLSALWFCLCLNPLSNALNSTSYGFNIKHQNEIKHKINHLLYMDDIKIYASTKTQMAGLLKTVEDITTDIRMEFGMSKCKMLVIQKGKWKEEISDETLQKQTLNKMHENETYKYLGFEQNTRLEHTLIKKELLRHYILRLKLLLKSKLNSKNLFKAINTFAISLLTYSFGIIKWTKTDIDKIHQATNKQLTIHRKHHPNACKERMVIRREDGGRGLIDIHLLHARQIKTLRSFFHGKSNSLHEAISLADNGYTPLNLSEKNYPTICEKTHREEISEQWAQKTLHGKHLHIMKKENIDRQSTYKWLQKGELFPETEGFLLAIQDHVIATKSYQKHILKKKIDDDLCRKCHLQQENVEHIIGGCKILAGTSYTERHNIAAKIIHQEIALTHNLIKDTKAYYQYTAESILEDKNYKLYYDLTIHTDKTIPANRPDITLLDKKQKTTYLIDISVPADINVTKKYSEKIEKYIPLAIEIERIWNQKKVYIIPLILSATGITHVKFTQHLEDLQLKYYIHQQVQKAVILKTSSIVRSFLKQ